MKKQIMAVVLVFIISLAALDIKGGGGPDSFGYRWIDSDETGGPVYSWEEISVTGTATGILDEDMATINLAFGFDYYGISYTSVNIFDNGFVSFSSSYNDFENTILPNTSQPQGVIAPFWCDMDPATQGEIYYYSDASKLIVQYDNVAQYEEPGGNTFQIIFYSSGDIVFQYKSMTISLPYYTVGFENEDGTKGLGIGYDSYIKDSLAVKIYYAGVIEDGTFVLSTGSLTYGNVTVGDTLSRVFTISNTHLDETMTGTITTCNGFTVSESGKKLDDLTKNYLEYTINASSAQQFNLLFLPVVEQLYNGTISITSSDASHPADSITVSGSGVVPNISITSPDTIKVQAALGSAASSNFTVNNTGLGDLNFTTGKTYLMSDIYKGSGGPDGGNYFWKDSDDPEGPNYSWIEISSSGTAIPTLLVDGVSDFIDLGFTFKFYNTNYTKLKISANGVLTFNSFAVTPSNTNIPNSNTPNNLLCPYWDDLDPTAQGTVYYYHDAPNSRFIVQYDNIPNYGTSNNNTFQIILNTDGTIVFQYKTITQTSYTVGLENVSGTIGTQLAYNNTYLKNSFAIRFRPVPEWISLAPPTGTVYNSGNQIISATCNASGMLIGDHYGIVSVNSNDPDTPSSNIPVKLTVVPISIPELSSPINSSAITDLTPSFNWSQITEASSYTLLADNNSDFLSPELNQTPTSNTFTPVSDMALGTYYWKVRANTASANGEFSPAWTFTIQLIPAIPSGIVTSIVSGNVKIDWNDAADATSYDVYSSEDPHAEWPSGWGVPVNVALSEYTYTPDGSKKFFRIVSKNGW